MLSQEAIFFITDYGKDIKEILEEYNELDNNNIVFDVIYEMSHEAGARLSIGEVSVLTNIVKALVS